MQLSKVLLAGLRQRVIRCSAGGYTLRQSVGARCYSATPRPDPFAPPSAAVSREAVEGVTRATQAWRTYGLAGMTPLPSLYNKTLSLQYLVAAAIGRPGRYVAL